MQSDKMREALCAEVVRILRDERKKKKISMIQLAEQSGLSQAMISYIERDLRNPTLDTLLRMTDALEVQLSDVLIKAKRTAKMLSYRDKSFCQPGRKPGSL